MACAPALPHDLGSLLLLTEKAGQANSGLIPLLPHGNTRGALDMGVRADRAAGYRKLTQPGLEAREMWGAALEQRVRAMYVMGLDPAGQYASARPALEALEFLVVQDMFLTETAQLADVVLPTVSFAERDGTYTNVERRVQRARQTRPTHAECRPDWLITQGIAQGLLKLIEPVEMQVEAAAAEKGKATSKRGGNGKAQATAVADNAYGAWDAILVAEVGSEMAERVPGYAGITHSALGKTGKRGTWGRQTNESIYYDGTNYENTEGVGLQYPAVVERGGATFSLKPLGWQPVQPDEQYPFVLIVQPLLYDADPLLRDSRLLAHVPEPYVAISRADARERDIRKGTRVRVTSAAGEVELPARVLFDMPEKAVLIPANLPGAPLDTLQTGPHTVVTISKVEE
jgi:NADH-quinone oxidoreductase subunit G